MIKQIFTRAVSGRRRWLLATPLALPVVGFAAFRAAVAFWPYPVGVDQAPRSSTVILDRTGGMLAAYASRDGQWCQPLSAEQISPHLLDAIVAVEDERFYAHGGVDWRGAAAAAWQDVTSLSFRRGASTIAMQVQRLRQPTPRRSLLGKVAQAVRACQIERTTDKRDVLVEYLNRAPFGGNLTGAGAASWRYFGKPCGELSLGQAALLAGLPQSPNRFRPDRHAAAAAARRDHVLDRMLACGMISADQRREAANEPVDATWHPLPQDAADDGLRPTLDRLALAHSGTVRTTIDPVLQHRAAAASADTLRAMGASHVSAVSVVVLDTASGRCLASVSRSTTDGGIDLTVRPRSSGSTLKPFIYAAAFDAGVCEPGTVLDDAPATWSGYQPGDYDHRFDGPEPAATALARSRNVPAIAVLSRVGVGRAVGVMQGAGLATLARTPDRYGLTLAVGGADVTPVELAEAYATLGRGGQTASVELVSDTLADDDPTPTIDRAVPDRAVPDRAVPEPAVPDRAVPEPGTPDQAVPERAVPDHAVVEPAVPDPAVPDRATPARAVPDRAVPDRAVPDRAVPDRAVPEPASPDRAVPDRAVPDRAVPDRAVPEPANPERSVQDRSTPERLRVAYTRRRVLRRSSCLAALACLADPDRTRAVWPAAVELGVAWKTGTSSGHRDAWCAAVTPRRTVVVWLGNANGDGSDALVGQEAAAPLALRILTAVDPGGAGFAPPARFLAVSSPSVERPRVGVELVSPVDRQEIVRDATVGPQRVELRARAAGAVWWFVDGAPVAAAAGDDQVWWEPTAGSHEVRVTDAAGHAAVVHVRVRAG
jgi:penicillin-binding protein 1C